MAGTVAAIPQASGGGLSTIQDLYDLINGRTTTTSGGQTTTSGGTSTTQSSEGISQDSMNAMLANALGATNGLAAISSGQRSAGGYSSATNQMLTNDLLTRTAAQIAASNKNVTSTTTTPEKTITTAPTATTVGGVTASGAATSAGFLAALQQLNSTTGAISGLKKTFFGDSPTAPATPVAGTDVGTNPQVSTAPIAASPVAGGPISDGSQAPAVSTPASTQSSGTDMSGSGGVDVSSLIQPPSTDVTNNMVDSAIASAAPVTTDSTGLITGDNGDLLQLADGGLVKKMDGPVGKPLYKIGSKMNPVKLADGGSVTKKSLGILGTNQFNSAPDPLETLAGSVSEAANAQAAQPTQSDNTTPLPDANSPNGVPTPESTVAGTVGDNAVSNIANGSNITMSGGDSTISDALSNAGDMVSRVVSGQGSSSDVGSLSTGINLLGRLTGNSTLAQVGQVGQIGSQPTLSGAALTAANIASKGQIGTALNLKDTLTNPGMANIVNTVAGFSPITALANSVAGMFGLPSLGSKVSTMTANTMSGDPLDNMLALNNNYGTGGTATPSDNGTATGVGANVGAPADGTATGMDTPNTDTSGAPVTTLDATPMVTAATTPDNSTPGPDTPASMTTGGSDATASSGYSSASDSNSASNDSSSSSGGGMANGGKVEGPGTGISDSIHAKLSDGEFVLPADVVRMIGVSNLEKLVSDHHVPAAVQKLKAFAKGK